MSGLGSSGARDVPNFWEGNEFDPGKNFDEIFRLMEMFFSNADRASWAATAGTPYEWDPESTYAQGYRERGAPEWLAQVLSLYSQVMEPDVMGLVGDAMTRGPKIAASFADTARDIGRLDPADVRRILLDPDTGRPITAYRAQTPSGHGPYTASMGVDDGAGYARYMTDSPDAARFHSSRTASVYEGQLAARPGGVLDLTGPANQVDPELMGRLRGYLSEVDPEGRMLRALTDYETGYSSGLDFLVEMQRTLGADNLGRLPQDIGIDLARIPHNKNFGRPSGVREGSEYIAFNQDAWRPFNVYTHDEFQLLYPRR